MPGKKLNFLLVDDDKHICRLMQFFLSPYGECVTAQTGKVALDSFAASLNDSEAGAPETPPFDAAFIDIMLPDINGYSLIQQFTELLAKNNIPLVSCRLFVVTSYDMVDEEAKKILSQPHVEFIRKPFSEETVLDALQQVGLITVE